MKSETDVTIEELKSELAKLKARNELLHAAIEASPAGILIATAPDGVIEFWNSSALGIRGDDSERLTGIPAEMHPATWQTFRPDGSFFEFDELPMSRALLFGETNTGVEVVICRPNGDERWVSANAAPVKDAEGNIVAGVVVFPDITDRRQSEAELKRFRGIVEVSPDLVAMTSPDSEILYLNPSGYELCGLPIGSQLNGFSLQDLLTEDSQREFDDKALPAATKTGIWQGDGMIAGTSGEEIPVSLLVIAHRNAKDEISYLSIGMRDLRSEHELESRLKQSREIEDAMRRAKGVAHDIGNMNMVVDSYAATIADSLDEDDPRRKDLDMIRNAATRSKRLADALLGQRS